MAGSQSLERGLEILVLLDKSPAPLGVREIARRMDLSATIVQRLVNTLAQFNFVTQDAETKRYAVGYAALGLGWSMMQKDRLISAAQPHLDRLATKRMLNTYLGKMRGNRVLYLLSIQSAGPIAIRSAPGSLAWPHSTALGKALLAEQSPDAARKLLSAEALPRLTAHTVTDVDQLLSQIDAVRSTGIAIVDAENIAGITSIGAVVREHSGKAVAAISVAYAPASSPEITQDEAASLVTEAARDISQSLGWSAPH